MTESRGDELSVRLMKGTDVRSMTFGDTHNLHTTQTLDLVSQKQVSAHFDIICLLKCPVYLLNVRARHGCRQTEVK